MIFTLLNLLNCIKSFNFHDNLLSTSSSVFTILGIWIVWVISFKKWGLKGMLFKALLHLQRVPYGMRSCPFIVGQNLIAFFHAIKLSDDSIIKTYSKCPHIDHAEDFFFFISNQRIFRRNPFKLVLCFMNDCLIIIWSIWICNLRFDACLFYFSLFGCK